MVLEFATTLMVEYTKAIGKREKLKAMELIVGTIKQDLLDNFTMILS